MAIAGLLARIGAGTVSREVGEKTASTVTRDASRDVLGRDVLKLGAPKRVVMDEAQLAKLEARIKSWMADSDAGKLELEPLLQQREAPLYNDPDLHARAHKALNGWVMGGKNKVALRDAYTRVVVQGEKTASPLDQTLVDLMATRKERWGRMATKEGLPMPDSFKLFRGVDGEYSVDAVLKAWSDPTAKTMEVPLFDLTSWSTHYEIADKFALQKAANVIYASDIPFEHTVADMYVDGGGFIKWCYDQSEVVVGKPKEGLRIPVQDAVVEYKGKTYAYADRQALADAWKQDHP